MKMNLPLIGFASGIAARDQGCGDGPLVLQQSDFLAQLLSAGIDAYWLDILEPIAKLKEKKLQCVAELSGRLAKHTQELTEKKQRFVVIGGDHSSAIGTWSGVATACSANGSMGLIWIDAHLDSHTPETSESGNIHGMPVACLLGYGYPSLTKIASAQIKLLPQNLTIIGVRSFEQGEMNLLQKLNVRIISQEELDQIGIAVALKEAHRRATQGTVGYGLSIDLDALDPRQVPGVGTPVSNGIAVDELCEALKYYADDRLLLGLELAEFNPHHDKDHLTKYALAKLLISLMQGG